MDCVLQHTLKELGVSLTPIDENNIQKIQSMFPVPREHNIIWADVVFGRRISGVVLTDVGLFIKGDKLSVQEHNEKVTSKKEKQDSIYQYIKWEYLNVDDFKVKVVKDKKEIYFNKSRILTTTTKNNFFSVYNSEYKKIVKEATISAENIFSDLEAVVPENFAAVNTKTGHGEMAEEALTLLDNLNENDAKVVGRTNEKNGADRLVSGIQIQTKYYSSGKGCIDACFDKVSGEFRYQNLNGEPMLIEVPKDKYADAINTFRKRILEGKVPGVTDPNDAAKYVKQGKLTYQQALNLCRPGTIESLTYDAATGAINCSFALGVTFLSTFIVCFIQTGDKKESISAAFVAGIQVFGLAFFAHMLTQQVARTTLTKQLIPLSTYLVEAMGYRSVQAIVNAIRTIAGKGTISGAAAMKQLSKILRSNVVTSAITFAVFSIPDTYNFFNKKVSTSQYTKNMLSLVGTMAAAGGGTLAASVTAAEIAGAVGTTINPGVGTAIGITGGLVGGFIGGTAIKIAGDAIREDDTIVLSRMFNGVVVNMIYDYMLQQQEIDVLIEKFNDIKHRQFNKLFKDVMSASQQEKRISDFIKHFYEEIIRERPMIKEPSPSELVEFIKHIGEANMET